MFDVTLKEKAAIGKPFGEYEAQWLQEVDRSGLPGWFKTLIYQHRMLPRIPWPLLI